MSNHCDRRAILVLECPWEFDSTDTNRTSVIPFVEGIGKLDADTDVYYANFYDKRSFEKALDCLCKRRFENAIVYVAAHGFGNKISDLKISELIFRVGEKSKTVNITGLMLGSCYVGSETTTMEVFLEGTHIKWAAGYASTSKWLEGTLIDCAILSAMSALDEDCYNHRHIIVNTLADAIAGFSQNFHIGDDYHDQPVRLKDSMQFVVQPGGRGSRAKTETTAVFETQLGLQLNDDS